MSTGGGLEPAGSGRREQSRALLRAMCPGFNFALVFLIIGSKLNGACERTQLPRPNTVTHAQKLPGSR